MNIKDTLLGIAIGDAFGAGIEFKDRDWVMKNIDFTKFVNAIEGESSKKYTAGNYTDDTEMTIGLIKALLSKKEFTADLLIKFWKDEYFNYKEKTGHMRWGHGSIRHFYYGKKTIDEIRALQQGRKYPGNAPAMRAVPLGFLKEELINEYAIINADATHPHPKARAASIIVARAAEYMIVKNENPEAIPESIIPYCRKHITGIDGETEESLLKVDQLPSLSYLNEQHYETLCGPQPIAKSKFPKGINGLPCDAMRTVGCALYVLKHSPDAMSGLKNSIYVGGGGDVDTLASICTGILGGRYGIGTLPKFMVEDVEGKEELEQLAVKFEKFISNQQLFI